MDYLDPEQLTFMEWFWICFGLVLAIFFFCCWLDLNYQFHIVVAAG